MTQAEVEAQFASLRSEVDQLRERESNRAKGWKMSLTMVRAAGRPAPGRRPTGVLGVVGVVAIWRSVTLNMVSAFPVRNCCGQLPFLAAVPGFWARLPHRLADWSTGAGAGAGAGRR